jgi:type II secretory pathway component PulJ
MKRTPQRPSGFSLTEMMIVGGLASLLVLMVSEAWSGLGRPSTDALARCRIAQEANLAAASLAQDFGGSLPGQPTGRKQAGRLLGRLVVDDSQLWLCYEGQPSNDLADWGAPDTVVTYEVQDRRLIRADKTAETAVVLADSVDRIRLEQRLERITIELTLSFRGFQRTYTFVTDGR